MGARLTRIAQAIGVAALVGVCCWISVTLTRSQAGASILWLPNGVLVGILLTAPTSRWPTFVVAGFIGHLLAKLIIGDPLPFALGLDVANTIEILIVAGAVRRRSGDLSVLGNVRHAGRVATLSGLVGCAVSGAIGAAMTRYLSPLPFATPFVAWYAAHLLGMAVFATVTIVVRLQGTALWGRPGHRLRFTLNIALVIATSLLVFMQARYPLLFLVIPPLLMAAFRHGFSGMAVGTAAVTTISISLTLGGYGPLNAIADVGANERAMLTQLFIGIACLTTLPIAFVMTERRRMVRVLRDSEARYRVLAEHSRDLVVRLRSDGTRAYLSPSMKNMLGWEISEFDQVRWDLVHPEDLPPLQQAIQLLRKNGEDVTVTYRVRHKDGHYIWLESNIHLAPPTAPGTAPDIIIAGRDVTRRVLAEQQLAQIARHDCLTGLPNRLQFNERLALALARRERHVAPLALMCMDIDHFKAINDLNGHAVGDGVLCEFARRLQHSVRAEDLAARLGGDEFVVLIEDLGSSEVPELIAQRLIATMSDPVRVGPMSLKVTTSIGIGVSRKMHADDDLLELADKALYRAKAAGRNTWSVCCSDDPATLVRNNGIHARA